VSSGVTGEGLTLSETLTLLTLPGRELAGISFEKFRFLLALLALLVEQDGYDSNDDGADDDSQPYELEAGHVSSLPRYQTRRERPPSDR
jgi:hypothetical protein